MGPPIRGRERARRRVDGSYAAGLVRTEGQQVLEVNHPHPPTRRRRGKSDPIDAELAARHVLAGNRPVIPKDTTGIVEAIRQLRVARDGAIKARTAALNALGGLIISAPEPLRQEILTRNTTRGRAHSAPVSVPTLIGSTSRASREDRAAVDRSPHQRARRRDRRPRRQAHTPRQPCGAAMIGHTVLTP